MNTLRTTVAVALCSAVAFMIGCGQKQETPPPQPANVEKAVEKPVAATTQPAVTPAPVVSSTPAPTVAPPAAAAPAPDQVQSLVDKAKSLITAKNYSEASNIVKQLSSMQLTPDQQKIVDELKSLIQNGLASQATSGATSAVGGLLNK